MRKTIIAGSRDFQDYEFLKEAIISCTSWEWENGDITVEAMEIVSGGARGADKLGEKYAKEMGLPLKVFPADWAKFGKSAGYIRNAEMAEYADMLIAFWDEKSRGTKHMIDLAEKNNLEIRIFKF